jgi:hypothetical protein
MDGAIRARQSCSWLMIKPGAALLGRLCASVFAHLHSLKQAVTVFDAHEQFISLSAREWPWCKYPAGFGMGQRSLNVSI